MLNQLTTHSFEGFPVKDGFNPSIIIKGKDSLKSHFTFQDIVKSTDQEARTEASNIFESFMEYRKNNYQKFERLTYGQLIEKEIDFYKNHNKDQNTPKLDNSSK